MKMSSLLKLAVFDLDYTVWQPEMYQLWGEPKLVEPSNRISTKVRQEAKTINDPKILVDSSRETPIRVFPGAAHALADINRLRQEGHDIQAAVASRTDEPHWAKICMDNLIVDDGTTLSQCFGNLVEIYYGDKTHHFRKLKEKTGIPYECMVFFDNEHYNIKQVAKLGVKCIYTPDGMRKHHWEEAKQKFNI